MNVPCAALLIGAGQPDKWPKILMRLSSSADVHVLDKGGERGFGARFPVGASIGGVRILDRSGVRLATAQRGVTEEGGRGFCATISICFPISLTGLAR